MVEAVRVEDVVGGCIGFGRETKMQIHVTTGHFEIHGMAIF